MIELILPGKGIIDLNKEISIPITFQFSDLQNPTAIKNTFSKTIKIPSSHNNDKIFNEIWQFDHVVFDFNPSQRTKFVLTNDGDIITSGYLKLDSIDYSDGIPTFYNVKLFGGVGDFFYTLSEKLVRDLPVDSANYTHQINRTSVINSWENDYYCYPLTYSGLYDNFDSDKIFTGFLQDGISGAILDTTVYSGTFYSIFPGGIITYTPGDSVAELIQSPSGLPSNCTRILYDGVNGRFLAWDNSDGADSVIYYTSGTNIESWANISISDSSITGSIRDIYCNTSAYSDQFKYFFIFELGRLDWGSDIAGTTATGLKINNYAYRYSRISLQGAGGNFPSVYVSCIGDDNNDTNTKAYYVNTSIPNSTLIITSTSFQTAAAQFGSYFVVASVNTLTWGIGSGTYQTVNYSPTTDEIRGITYAGVSGSGQTAAYFGRAITGRRQVVISINSITGMITSLVDDPNIDEYSTISYDTNSNIYMASARLNGNIIIRYGRDNQSVSTDWNTINGFYSPIDPDNTQYTEYQRNEYRSYYQRPMLRVKHILNYILDDSGFDYELDSNFFNSENPYYENTWIIMSRLSYDGDPPEDHVGNIRSGDTVNFRQMMNSGVNQLEFLTSYCKKFGLLFIHNPVTGAISIQERKTYFQNYTTTDYTEKIDKSKPYKLSPLTFDFKYGIIQDVYAGSHYEELYSEKYPINYGSVRVDTGYEFDNSEKLFSDGNVFQNVIFSTEYDRLFENRSSVDIYADDKILPALFTKSGNEMSYNESGMHLVFKSGMREVSPIKISDDNPNMLSIGLFMWSELETDYTTVTSIPNVFRVGSFDGFMYSLDYARPADFHYQIDINDYPEGSTLYNRFWKTYIEEVYNVNNKILTAYLRLNTKSNIFNHADFFIIENTVFFVNKVIDYNPMDTGTVKCELVRVNDISNYNGQDAFIEFLSNISTVPAQGGIYNIDINANRSFTIEINKQ